MALATSTYTVKFGDSNENSGNINDSFNTTVYISDKDVEILRWLSPLEPDSRHHGVRTERHEGVGDWLFETREFGEWRGGEGGADQAVLFCSGNPGVGKTYLSSLVIDKLCDQKREGGIAVAWLYCDYKTQQEQTAINILGAILKRLVGSEIPQNIREAFRDGRRPLLAELKKMLRTAIASSPQVFICIDALDECLPKNLPELLESLRDVARESPSTRIFLTGRPHVKGAIERYFSRVVTIPISPNPADIRSYLKMRLDRDDEPEAMTDSLRAEILEKILDKMSNTFLLVSLNIEAILCEVTISQRREKLEEMARGNGLSDAYTATLMRLKAQKGNRAGLGLKALMWVSYSERPLEVEELCHALGVKIGSTDLDQENVPAIRTLLASCLGLLAVEATSSTVRLLHFTLQEYLLNDPTLLPSPHSAIAEVCLTYLNFGSVRELSPTLDSAPSKLPLLQYASLHWGKHAREGITGDVKRLALGLLDKFDEHISAQLLLLHDDRDSFTGIKNRTERWPSGFTGLHGVAFFGIVEIVFPVLEMKKWEVNAADCTGNTALIWAARWGHEGIVKALLERKDINPDQGDTQYCLTPLSWAAKNGKEGVVKMLLEREDVDPNCADRSGRAPLLWAARKGNEGVVKLLLEREDVNPNHADKYGRAPISWAAKEGHEGIVKMLLEREDVDPDHADTKYSLTPLVLASGFGHEGVVKMLLEREDVNPNHADTYGRAPISWVAEEGHEGVAKMLLEREDVNPNHVEIKFGQTPLMVAANCGNEGVVKMLLEREDINPNHVDKYGRAPISWAAEGGQEGIVKMLLEREDFNPDQADTKYGRTPIFAAAHEGHQGIVKMFLERRGVNPDCVDTKYGRTPLMVAAQYGNEGVVKMLLEREDVDPNRADTEYGRAPISWAAEGGYEGVVKLLLEREGINPDHVEGEEGRTPLSLGAENGHAGIVKMLLERASIDADHADTKYGPCWEGTEYYDSDDDDSEDSYWEDSRYPDSDDPYWIDSRYSDSDDSDSDDSDGNDSDSHDSDSHDSDGDDSDSHSSDSHDSDSSDSDSEGNEGSNHGDGEAVVAPLLLALPEGHNGAARILVDPDNANLDRINHGGQTSLPPTPENRDESVVEIQFRSPDLNTDIIDFNSQPSLQPADPDEREPASGPKDPAPTSPNSPRPTKSSMLPQPSPTWPLKFLYPPQKSNAYPNDTRSTFPVVANRYWVIGLCVCLLAFLAYRMNSYN